jgi:hypothetical protein
LGEEVEDDEVVPLPELTNDAPLVEQPPSMEQPQAPDNNENQNSELRAELK